MATIRKRGTRWEVQVRRKGHPALTKSFETRSDAAIWARAIERSIDRGECVASPQELAAHTVRSLLTRYRDTITPTKRGASSETYRVRVILAHPLADLSLRHLNSAEIARYRDDRLEKVTGASVRRELAILRHCLETARRDWKIPLRTNPVQEVRVPAPPQARERRLQDTEATKLFQAIRPTSAAYLRPMIQLALETGMRRGELLALRWSDVELATRTVLIRHSKNGHSRRIPLTPGAMNILASLDRHEGTVFNVSANAFRLAWERLKRRAGIEGLRFHDLRHEAVSRFFELGLNVPEVAMISGHRDARMLFRYTHPRPELVADKLASAHATRPTAVTGAHTIAPE